MNAAQIENNLQHLIRSLNTETFIYDLLLAYDTPKSNVKRLRDGALNLSKIDGEILWKKKLLFKEAVNSDPYLVIDALKADSRIVTYMPRFIIVTDFKIFLAIDTKNQGSLDISILNLAKHFDFFLPIAGMEKAEYIGENPADVKAAEKMAKLYDEIKKDNPTTTQEEVHALNVFLSRLLFCFFAEDTEIFSRNKFTNSIRSHVQADASDLKAYLERLFLVLNTNYPRRENLPEYLNTFPYVNGGLFKDQYGIPVFTRKSLNAILECGDLDWKDINPDIFGSMIQAVITPEHRGGLGMHYTSVPNIMKVIEPLFLDELKEEFEASKNQPKKLEKLLYRLSKLKIFDPACGSGNFLIIAYKELRFLEIEIIKHFEYLQHTATGFEEKQLALIPKAQQNLAAMYQKQLFSQIQLTQFYGIELDDFAHEIAILSLWLAQHQMNMKFKEVLGQSNPTLPLKEGGHITHGNATRLRWELVCPKKDQDETYILGNPPYLGFNERDKNQKTDMDIALKDVQNVNRLDYIGCWFVKATDYINNSNARYSFVSTNSICQGEQVSLLWPYVFSKNQEIFFAHTSFKWANSAKANAAVICVILGIQNKTNNIKKLYSNNSIKIVKGIGPYLIEGGQTVIAQRTNSISNFKTMCLGSSGIDGGHLMLSRDEKDLFVLTDSATKRYIKPFVGGQDFLDKNERYCIWIEDNDVQEAYKSDLIKTRIDKCRIYRLSAGRDAKKAAGVPHRFFYRKYKEQDALILPMTSSERRNYIPVGFFNPGTVFSNGVFVVYEPPTYLFSILSSSMHMAWIKITSGRLKSDIRYSVNLTYNNFPFPNINGAQERELEKHAFNILDEREQFSEKTLAQLYDADKMPQSLKEIHHQLDLAVERCYRSKPFENDQERLEFLFKLHANMLTVEKSTNNIL